MGQHQKSLQIREDDKFFSRLLSKESSMTNPSCRVLYYGGAAGAVPFTWESRPGTPKHTLCDHSLPPLTPPPSYQSNYSNSKSMERPSKPSSSFLYNIFSRLQVSPSSISCCFLGRSGKSRVHFVEGSRRFQVCYPMLSFTGHGSNQMKKNVGSYE